MTCGGPSRSAPGGSRPQPTRERGGWFQVWQGLGHPPRLHLLFFSLFDFLFLGDFVPYLSDQALMRSYTEDELHGGVRRPGSCVAAGAWPVDFTVNDFERNNLRP